jgi:hypothetical protein
VPVEPVEVAKHRVVGVPLRGVGNVPDQLLDYGAISRPPGSGVVTQDRARVDERAVVILVVVVVRVAVVG